MSKKIHIGIAEDHGLVRQGFVRMLQDYQDIVILFEAANGKELLASLRRHKPSVVLLDIAMPVLGGIGAMERIRKRYPKLKIIVISAYAEEISIVEYVRLGAHAFLNKDCTVEELVEALRKVNETGSYFDKHTIKLLTKHNILPASGPAERQLTERETAILKLLCADESAFEIAHKMNLKEKTVEWYKHILLQKTNCKDIGELISYAKKSGLI